MVDFIPNYVDMSITPEERAEDYDGPEIGPQSKYPYGLCISMCQDELEKLDLEDECDIGDMIELHCIAKVTSVSKRDTDEGPQSRIEFQIIAIAAEGDDEDEQINKMPTGRRPY